MKKIKLETTFTVFDDISELSNKENLLLMEAIKVRNKAYAPYSNFSVGAAILLDNGKIITGNNQENAAYPSGMCAERVAIFSAGALNPDSTILKIAISASSSNKKVTKPVGPCGSCRQVIAEYEYKQERPIEIFFMGETGQIIKTDSLKDLLPLSFDSSYL
jgi:cytidine deaminase